MSTVSRNISRNYILSLFCILQFFLVLIIIFGFRINTTFLNQGQNVVEAHNAEVMSLVTDNIKTYLNSVLSPAQKAVQFSHNMVLDKQLNHADNAQLQQYFFRQLQDNPTFSGAYFGRPDGSFIFVKREVDTYSTKIVEVDPDRRVEVRSLDQHGTFINSYFDAEDSYSPLKRPWYLKALSSSEVIWTEPYTFFSSQNIGITTAISVKDSNNQVLGVLGVDVELGTLSSYLQHFTFSEYQSFPFIISQKGQSIAAPQLSPQSQQTDGHQSQLFGMQTVQTLFNINTAQKVKLNEIVEFQLEDKPYLGLLSKISVLKGQPWLLGIYAPKEVYGKHIGEHYRNNISTILMLWLLFSGLAFVLSFLLTRPLQRLYKRASTDPLTGLLNRRAFITELEFSKEKAEQTNAQGALFIVDLDNFKPINDTYGHATGDEVLVTIAKRLKRSIRSNDIVARIGGDEFAIYLSSIKDVDLYNLGCSIRDSVLKTAIVSKPNEKHSVGLTMGAIYLDDEIDPEISLTYADNALVEGKTVQKGEIYIATYDDRLLEQPKLNLRGIT